MIDDFFLFFHLSASIFNLFFGYSSTPIIGGTLKKDPVLSGAFFKESSTLNEAFTVSSLSTHSTGIA
jgi:hypothetical protein